MLRTIALSLGLLAAAGVASAADLKVKAPVGRTNPYISFIGSGYYLFVGGFGEQTDLATGTGRLSATGAGVSGGAGWMWGRGATWIAADVRGNYSTTSAATMCGSSASCDFRRNASAELRVKYGSDSSTLANLLPNLGLSSLYDILPVLPGGVSTPSHPYAFLWARGADNKTDVAPIGAVAPATGASRFKYDVGAGVGMVHQLDAKKVIDVWAKCGLSPGQTQVGLVANSALKIGGTCGGGMDIIF